MSRHTSIHKVPLALLESPENGQVHKYGSPIVKTLKPCQAKVVPCQDNIKWVSPDTQLMNKKQSSNNYNSQQRRARKKITMQNNQFSKLREEEKANQDSCTTDPSSSHRVVYGKLDFVSKIAPQHTSVDSDDNKENVPPEGTVEHPPHSSTSFKSLEKQKVSKNSSRYLSNTSSRVNRL